MLIDKSVRIGNFMFLLMAHRYHEVRLTKTGIYSTIEVAIGVFDIEHFSLRNPHHIKSLMKIFVLSDFLLNRRFNFNSQFEEIKK